MSQRDATVKEVRNRINSIDEDIFRYAFMYQFLIGGEPSEVCGEYAPIGNDVSPVEFTIKKKKIPAAAFIVKTARRKGRHRLCIIPLEPQYEPWAKPVFDWFQENKNNKPFELGKRKKLIPKHNQNTLQVKAREVF